MRSSHADQRISEKRVRGDWAKSRSRFSRASPRRENPREHPAVGILNLCRAARDSGKGRSPGTAAREAGLSATVEGTYSREKTVGGCIEVETPRYLSGGEGSEGIIPGALPG
jgi:hypothetical protein